MKPHAAVKGETHALAAACEFSIGGRYWQLMRPSDVAGGTGAADPEYNAHNRPGAYKLVVEADHPDPVACTTCRLTPADGEKLLKRTKFFVYFELS